MVLINAMYGYGEHSTELLIHYHHNSFIKISVRCECGRSGGTSRSGMTQCIKMGSCIFHCDVPHQKIAQRHVGHVSEYCDGLGCHVLCLRHGFPVLQHIGQSTTAISRHPRDLRCKNDVKTPKEPKG